MGTVMAVFDFHGDTADLTARYDKLRKIDKQTLIVHGRDDKVIPLDTSLRLMHLIDRSQLHVFGRCGHWVQIERAGDFARLVDDFLSH